MATGLDSSPEYLAFQKCYQMLVGTVKAQPGAFCDALFAEGYITESVRDFSRNRFTSDEEKAQKLIDKVIDRIKIDTRTFFRFIEMLKSPSTENVAELLQQHYERECELLKPVSENEERAINSESSDHESLHSCEKKVRSDYESDALKCTMDKFFSEEGCPQKQQLPESKSALFPYLDIAALPDDERAAFEVQLKYDTRKMITRFADFTVITRESLEERGVPLGKIKDTVLSLEAFLEDIGVKLLEPQDKDSIRKSLSVPEIFITLRDYISFFNYQIIEHLIKHHGSADDRNRMDEYLIVFTAFCQRSVFEVPPNVFCNSHQKKGKMFAFKCTERVATLKGVQGITEKIAEVFNLHLMALRLCSIKKGCIELHFLISSIVADYIFPVSSSEHSALSEIGVTVLFCEKLNQKKLQENQKALFPQEDLDTAEMSLLRDQVFHTELNKKAEKGNIKLFHRLAKKLMDACRSGSVSGVLSLVEQGADINYLLYGSSPLLASIKEDHTDVAQLLIDKGADVNKVDQFGTLPLLAAIMGGHTETAKLLIDKGADVNKCDKYGTSPLWAAIMRGHTEVAQLLLNLDTDVNKCNKYGISPLLAACERGHTEFVKLLLEKGADVNKCDNCGRAPIWIAVATGHALTAKLLIDKGANCGTYSHDF